MQVHTTHYPDGRVSLLAEYASPRYLLGLDIVVKASRRGLASYIDSITTGADIFEHICSSFEYSS
jgi:hypothetical protein